MPLQKLLCDVWSECKKYTASGAVANYIPELAKTDPHQLGICIASGDASFSAGDSDEAFTMQSVVKPLILLLALSDSGAGAVERLCGAEATGKPFDTFNYSDKPLASDHINPMVNAGSIALCTLIKGDTKEEKFDRLLALVRRFASNPDLSVDEAVFLSECETGNKNRALAYMLKSYRMIDGNIEDILYVYFRACSISVTCRDIARIALVLANRGKDVSSGEQLVRPEQARYITAIMAICGMYDGSGEFALRVGIPAKSGVGGGIMAVVPNRMGIGIFSPALNPKGNSVAGVKALERLSRELDLSVF